MADIKCRNCGAELLPGAKYCSKCRSAVVLEETAPSVEIIASAEVQHCSSCGAEMLPGAKFCSKCRTPVNGAVSTEPESPFAVFRGVVIPDEASKGAVIRTAVIVTVCLTLLILGIVFIPGRVRDARDVEEQDEFIVAEDTTNEEQAAEYDRINAAFEAGEYENYEPETDEIAAEYYEEEFGPYEWMNYTEEEAD